MGRKIVHILFILSLSAQAQFYKDAKYPNFSCSAGTSLLAESSDFGVHGRLCLPTGNGMNLYLQGQYAFPSSANYKEYRMEVAWELAFLKFNQVSLFAVGGYNWGYWQMNKVLDNSHNYTLRHKDNSLFYGGGVFYDFNFNWSVYGAYKVYPSIYSSYVEVGVKFNYYSTKPKVRKRGKVFKPSRK